MRTLFLQASCVLPVSNMDRALRFYTAKLGFEIIFSWNTPIEYSILKRENVQIHLALKRGFKKGNVGHTSIYVFVNNIRYLYQEYESNQVRFHRALNLQEYGMTDFDIKDVDGHIITFGQTEQ